MPLKVSLGADDQELYHDDMENLSTFTGPLWGESTTYWWIPYAKGQ